MIQILYSAHPPCAEDIWDEMLHWRQRIRDLLNGGRASEGHLIIRQELAPRMKAWSQACGLPRPVQLIHLRNFLKVLSPRENAETPDQTPPPLPARVRKSEATRIRFDDIPAIIDALDQQEQGNSHARAS